MNRYAVRIGSVLALLLTFATALPVRADQQLTLQLDGKPIVFTGIRMQNGARAIAADSPAVQTLLDRIGATLTWQPGQRYVLVTTGEPVVISFAIGDTTYDVGPVEEHARFAPFLAGGHPYIPLNEFIHALDFAIKPDGSQLVLQPQLAELNVQSGDGGTKLVAHAGMPLDGRIVEQSASKIVAIFDGVGSTLPASRSVSGGAISRIDVRTLGTVTDPKTEVTLVLSPGAPHGVAGTDDQRDFTVAFGNAPVDASAAVSEATESATPQPLAQPAAPVQPQTSPQASGQQPVQVTSVETQPQNASFIVRINVSGDAAYDWHRLRPPDDRFWIDIHGAQLAIPPQDEPGSDPVTAVRVHQQASDVRVALSLSGFDTIAVTPNATGITITVSDQIADDSAVRSGSGSLAGGELSAAATPAPSPGAWKFGPSPSGTPYVASNPRLIVLDPGHGGSDPGSYRGDLVEKTITLDISKRIRDILVARGWQVVMTRTTDRDVYQPDDSAADELQARDDIANNGGARLFVSVHVNAFMNAGPHGATVYYYKPSDVALAQAVDHRIATELSIKNDGIVKDKLYVVHHADMPAALVETAFISNPGDRALLASDQWRQAMAQAIADGICDYAGTPPPAQTVTGAADP